MYKICTFIVIIYNLSQIDITILILIKILSCDLVKFLQLFHSQGSLYKEQNELNLRHSACSHQKKTQSRESHKFLDFL